MSDLAFLPGVESLLLEEFRALGQARVDAVNPLVRLLYYETGPEGFGFLTNLSELQQSTLQYGLS